MGTIRVGIAGLGANSRLQHVPKLKACDDVEIVGVVNRRPESTAAAAQEFGIPRTYETWEQLVADDEIDAVVISTWPYLHCPITLAALEVGKHVLTEARMAMNADEAHQMLEASRRHPELVTQIVPSPIGFHADRVIKRMLNDGYLGDLREVIVIGSNDSLADAKASIHWRQSAEYSGMNALFMGIMHETLIRWVPDPTRVYAQSGIYTPQRRDAESGEMVEVGTPDVVHVLTELSNGARGVYHLNAGIHFGPALQIHLYGTDGTLKYEFEPKDRLLAGKKGDDVLKEVTIDPGEAYDWRVEEDFVEAIRGQREIDMTDFATGVRYMEFTEAVARSSMTKQALALPLL